MRVLITRPKEDAAAIRQELRGRGIQVMLDPMLVIEHFEDEGIDLSGAQGLLFTSSNGVRAFAMVSEDRSLPTYCVGDETARTCRGFGFSDVHSAAGDVDTLANYVIGHCRPEEGRLIHVAGSVAAGDLAGALGAQGFTVDRVPLYRAAPATALADETRTAMKNGRLDGILFFSPRTALTFVNLARTAGLADSCRGVIAFCLSAAVAKRVEALPWRRVVVAAEPSRAALLTALDNARPRTD